MIVDTGQQLCYDGDGNVISPSPGDPLYGQDAQYAGVAFSFQDNGDGTVTDLNTGLTWQQIPASTGFSWEQAVEYCQNLSLGGYDDWRIPSVKELFSISDYSQSDSYLDSTYFSHSGPGKDRQYWSGNYYSGLTREGLGSAFGVNHGVGHIKAYPADAELPPEPPSGPPPSGPPPSGNPAYPQRLRCVRERLGSDGGAVARPACCWRRWRLLSGNAEKGGGIRT